MKRIVALILTVIMIFALVACDKEKAEKYCWSCGEGITKSAVFCEHCGAKINESSNDTTTTTTTTSHSEEEETSTTKADETTTSTTKQNTRPNSTTTTTKDTTTTTKPSTTKVTTTTTTKKTTTAHTHSYTKTVTPATCTSKGYTTYTCSCGDTYTGNYTNPSHTYTEFICRLCGTIDKANAYKYLTEYVKANGKASGSYVSIVMRESNGQKYELSYDAQNKCLWATCRETSQNAVITTGLMLEEGYYGLNYVYKSVSSDLTGFIDPKTFNENSAMTYEVYTGVDSAKTSTLNLARSSLVLTLMVMEMYFDANNVGLNVYALGYMGMQ